MLLRLIFWHLQASSRSNCTGEFHDTISPRKSLGRWPCNIRHGSWRFASVERYYLLIIILRYHSYNHLVWHGTQEKYQLYNELGGRFNSEFGMEALPHINTIKSFCSDNSQLFPQSRLLDFHNKAAGHERRLAIYLMENFKIVADLEVR